MFLWERPSGWQNSSSAVFFIESVGYQEVPEIVQGFQLRGVNLRLSKPQKMHIYRRVTRGCFKWKKRCTISGFLPYPAHPCLIEVRIAWVGLPAAPVEAVNPSFLRSIIPEEVCRIRTAVR
ncbi:hypothetical protein [Paenibacillus durus]|uniref:hypothetical protein n=1 Tax=Paenibacillus durus TaxID=44251 RepID=UPI001187624B|nr:hypothetical protein [Paenibacillus durus]